MDKVMALDNVLAVISDRNLLLIALNRLLAKDSLINESNHRLTTVLMPIVCKHSDPYVRYSSAKVLINCLIDNQLDIELVLLSDCWHCLPQICKFLCRLSARLSSADKCVDFESKQIITEISKRLTNLCESNEQLCEDHCLCSTPEAVLKFSEQTNDENLNNILSNFIKLMAKQQKRCFVNKFLNLLVSVVQQNSDNNNSLSMNSISKWVFNPLFFETINILNTFYAFGGKYSSESEELKNDFGFDSVLLRLSVNLYLLTLSSDFILKTTSKELIENRLQFVSQIVRKKCKKFDENDWIIKLFIEEDEQLLSGLYAGIKLGDNQNSHFLMKAFIESIDCDSGVLLDLLCGDEQTATLLLKILLFFLKLSDISTNISMNVKNVLLDLNNKMERLSDKQLFPYNVQPIIKLMHRLRA